MIVHSQQMEARAALFAEGEALQTVPPSERDFLVFGRVVIESATTRAAAEEFGLSQTRVMQIRQRVAEWIGSQVPETPRLTARQRLGLASHVAEGRIDHLYSQAMEAWRGSQGTQTTVRTSDHGETTITRESYGDIKYLSLAARIAERKFGVVVKGVEAVEKVREERVQSPTSEVQSRASEFSRETEASASGKKPSHREADASRSPVPPVGDCSRFSAPRPAAISSPAAAQVATADESVVYDEIERRRRAFLAALADDTSPVQPPRVDAGGLLIEESEEGEEMALAAVLPMVTLNPALSLEERENDRLESGPTEESGRTSPALRTPLNRRERRARQRMLQKKLKLRKAK